ncbi:MAG TPA: dienelactone hydrolase family protein [Microvirga sp.]|jgi:dienelactone hydrolase|nr:dienelactone hydrolase family protein [Microvirga sp.]
MRRLRFLPLLAASLLAATAAAAATPPAQPKSGPGGADYAAEQVVKRAVGRASAATFVFHAANRPDKPRPVVVFFHSWGAANPQLYGGWIEHLARKGYLVLYPRFQDVNRTRPADATGLAVGLVKDALEALANDAEARPDPARVAYVGHLAGAAIALNLAAGAQGDGLPVPKLVYALMPGGIASDPKSRGIPLEDLSELDASTLLITMSGDRENIASDRAARRILKESANVPANRKLFMRAGSDDHGFPTTAATLASPGSVKADYDAAAIKLPPDPPRDPKQKPPGFRWTPDMALSGEQTVLTQALGNNVTDPLDYYAYWKTFDMAAEAAFAGKDAAALRADPKFIDMGAWSDGWPMRRLTAEMPKVEGQEPKPAGPRRVLPPAAQ